MKECGDAEDKGNGDNGNPGAPEQGGALSQPHSDSTGSIPSNREPASLASKAGSALDTAGRNGGRRILIVDDEVNIADTLQLIFKMRR
jgi:hypothetical protein